MIGSPTARVLLALAAGAGLGLALAAGETATANAVADAVAPIGRLWLNALQMTVVPLVLALVVVGISATRDAAASGRTARRAITVFIVLLSAAAAFTAIAAPALLSLLPRDPALAEALRGADAAPAGAAPGWGDALAGLIPSNAVAAAAQGAMLPLVAFALFLGFAVTRIERARRERLVELFQAIADAMIVIVGWVLWAAPLGVFALVLAVTARSGLSMLSALGIYVVLEVVLHLAVAGAMVVVAVLWGGENLRRFIVAVAPAQAVAVSTQSSLASLPAMLQSAQALQHPRAVAALVLPMAVSLFRITSPVQYVSSAALIAWAFGIDLSAAQLASGAALAVVVSLGSVGLPGQVTFMATNLPVAQAMGLPVAPLGLLLAVETVPDMFATMGNVTADVAANSIVARQAAADPVALDARHAEPPA